MPSDYLPNLVQPAMHRVIHLNSFQASCMADDIPQLSFAYTRAAIDVHRHRCVIFSLGRLENDVTRIPPHRACITSDKDDLYKN